MLQAPPYVEKICIQFQNFKLYQNLVVWLDLFILKFE